MMDICSEDELKKFHMLYQVMSNKKMDCVYFIQNEHTKLIKIGTTNDVSRRLKDLSSTIKNTIGMEYSLDLLAVIFTPFGRGYILEKEFHNKYKEQRKNGEWFEITLREIMSDERFCSFISVNDCFATSDLDFVSGNQITKENMMVSFNSLHLYSICYDEMIKSFDNHQERKYSEIDEYKNLILLYIHKNIQEYKGVRHNIDPMYDLYKWLWNNQDISLKIHTGLISVDGSPAFSHKTIGFNADNQFDCIRAVDDRMNQLLQYGRRELAVV